MQGIFGTCFLVLKHAFSKRRPVLNLILELRDIYSVSHIFTSLLSQKEYMSLKYTGEVIKGILSDRYDLIGHIFSAVRSRRKIGSGFIFLCSFSIVRV